MKRLLVVDDALFMRKLICGVAAEAGWQVAGEATNGEQAVALYEQLKPDLVTMDVVMPIMGGLEALRKILELIPRRRSSSSRPSIRNRHSWTQSVTEHLISSSSRSSASGC